MKDQQQYIKGISKESLDTFEDIYEKAIEKSQGHQTGANEAFASMNTFTDGGGAVNKLGSIRDSNLKLYQSLATEPAISRIVVMDENGNENIYYISRKSTVALDGEIKLASYRSQIGRLAAVPVGDEISINVGGESRYFELLEKARYRPERVDDKWDSRHTVFEGDEYGPLTVESLKALLSEVEAEDIEALLNAQLSGGEEGEILDGLRHEVRTSMELRDQPILDRFQDEIFRLPIDSKLLIMGPPGTGKTTTLIRRLGQKLDLEFLDPEEKELLNKPIAGGLSHQQSWLMFTPTDLLKHFVKEAFNREQVPASDQMIKTWKSHRNEISRNVLGVLQSPTTAGKFILKARLNVLHKEVIDNPIVWFEQFKAFHCDRILLQLTRGIEILETLKDADNSQLIDSLNICMNNASSSKIVSIYRKLDALEADLKPHIKSLKAETDTEIRKYLVKSFNENRQFLHELASFLDTLKVEDELEIDDEFDDESSDDSPIAQATTVQKAEIAYNRAIRSFSKYKYLKRSLPKAGRAAKIREWLGKRVPPDEVLISIGESIAKQNGLRRFVNSSKRYVADVPASYREFRKTSLKKGDWYTSEPEVRKHIGQMELDAIVLLMLKSARDLLVQNYVLKNIDENRYTFLRVIQDRFRIQILVDEATDFSVIQLACMESLTALETRSFFACGDFNQRITSWGTRNLEQINWITDNIDTRSIKTVYRQSKKLNEFSGQLLQLIGGDLSNHGELPDHMNHTGFSPVLTENCSGVNEIAEWLSVRIQEVERSVNIGQMPTVAILVNSENEVRPMAEALNALLEDMNLKAVACSEGQSLGEGTDVRVFDIQHIKGLEFEAVFFVGIDKLATLIPDLFGKYMYVGATRAATYFGVTCEKTLPKELLPLKKSFLGNW